MNRYKKIIRRIPVLLAALVLMLSSAVTAYAADGTSLDLDRTGSVALTLTDGDGNTVSGGEITIFEVASLYLDDGDMAYALTEGFKDCTAVLDVTDTALPSELAQYVNENNITGTTVAVGTDGTVTFDDLELGLYLVVQTTSSDDYETISPFVMTVPVENGDAWDYSVDASPKVGTVTLTEPETPEEETPPATTETTLPQTGQLKWPIPVLACCGLLLFALGWFLKRTDKRKNNA